MNYKLTILIFFSIFLIGCEPIKKSDRINIDLSNKYKNFGFTLIYNDNLGIKKKLDDRSLEIFHETLKIKSSVKITNPNNGKSLIAKVKSNKVVFSKFYNSVISLRIAQLLEIDFEEPYIEIILISDDTTFVAKRNHHIFRNEIFRKSIV